MAHRGCNAVVAELQFQLAEAHLALRVYADPDHWQKDTWNVLAAKPEMIEVVNKRTGERWCPSCGEGDE